MIDPDKELVLIGSSFAPGGRAEVWMDDALVTREVEVDRTGSFRWSVRPDSSTGLHLVHATQVAETSVSVARTSFRVAVEDEE
jgi:hypothetical protein